MTRTRYVIIRRTRTPASPTPDWQDESEDSQETQGTSGGLGIGLVIVAIAYGVLGSQGVVPFPDVSSGISAAAKPPKASDIKAGQLPPGASKCQLKTAAKQQACKKAKIYAYELLKRKGMGNQFAYLDKLWEHESNWDHLNWNDAGSGAYGIPQALPAKKMATEGEDWLTNPETQVRWGIDYIISRYNTPQKAWAFWNRTDPRPYSGNWY